MCLAKTASVYDADTLFGTGAAASAPGQPQSVIEAIEGAVWAEPQPAILMCALGAYEALAKLTASIDMLATRILPRIAPLMCDRALNMSQFKQFLRVTREAIARIDETRTKELEKQMYIAKQSEEQAASFVARGSNSALDSFGSGSGSAESMEAVLSKEYGMTAKPVASVVSNSSPVVSAASPGTAVAAVRFAVFGHVRMCSSL